MVTIEKSGKTVDDALNLALSELKTTIDKVDYEVLEQGSKGILGFGSKPAKIKVTLRFDPVNIAKTFLKEVFISMGLLVDFEITHKEKRMDIMLKGDDLGVIIGKRGQTLDSLQYLVNLAVNKGNAPYVSITLDTANYRERRKETLEKLAFNLAKKVKMTKKSVSLEPMNPFERRVIHATLQNDRFVVTSSDGDEPFRYVVISLKNNKSKTYTS